MNEMEQKEQVFFKKVMELCVDAGKAYGFDCPVCGNYAMGLRTPSGNAVIGSCASCHIAGKHELSGTEVQV